MKITKSKISYGLLVLLAISGWSVNHFYVSHPFMTDIERAKLNSELPVVAAAPAVVPPVLVPVIAKAIVAVAPQVVAPRALAPVVAVAQPEVLPIKPTPIAPAPVAVAPTPAPVVQPTPPHVVTPAVQVEPKASKKKAVSHVSHNSTIHQSVNDVYKRHDVVPGQKTGGVNDKYSNQADAARLDAFSAQMKAAGH